MAHIFISYAKKDTRPLAEKLFNALNNIDGLVAWMDKSLEPDTSWATQIQSEIDQTDYVIVLLSPDVNRLATPIQPRSFVLNEIDYAQQEKKIILPVMVYQTKMPIQIAGVQYINLTQTPNDPMPIVSWVTHKFNVDSKVMALDEKSLFPAHRYLLRMSIFGVVIGLVTISITLAILARIESETSTLIPTTVMIASLENTSVVAQPTTQLSNTPDQTPTPTPSFTEIVGTLEATRISQNADWTPIERDFDGVTMVLVPPGCFEMGLSSDVIEELETLFPREDAFFQYMGPSHEVCIRKAFWLDQTEVTQIQFSLHGGEKISPNRFIGNNNPVENITWLEAHNYCVQRGVRLPSEAEWEFAARGPDNLTYPWGNEFIPENVTYGGNSGKNTKDVYSRPNGKSWVNALDMIGNVWEYTASVHQAYPYPEDNSREQFDVLRWHVIRGGSWDLNKYMARPAYRGNFPPELPDDYIGFRCARDFE